MITVKITNKTGLHARPASQFVNLAKQFDSSITIKKDQKEYDAKSIMNVMMAMISQGDEVTIQAAGSDAKKAEAALETFIKELTD